MQILCAFSHWFLRKSRENEGTVGLTDLPETSGASFPLVLPVKYLRFPALPTVASFPSEVFQAGNIHSPVLSGVSKDMGTSWTEVS